MTLDIFIFLSLLHALAEALRPRLSQVMTPTHTAKSLSMSAARMLRAASRLRLDLAFLIDT
jgi:hypothetical protein